MFVRKIAFPALISGCEIVWISLLIANRNEIIISAKNFGEIKYLFDNRKNEYEFVCSVYEYQSVNSVMRKNGRESSFFDVVDH